MRLNDEELGRLYREGTRRAGGESCPEAGSFQRVLLGDAGPAEREALADHLAGCADCAGEFRLAREVQRGLRGPAGASRARWLGVAATFLLVSTAALFWFVARDEPRSGRRGESAPGVVVAPAHRAVLDRAPARLSWTGQPDGAYRVEVYDAESVPLWSSPRTRQSFVDLPAELRDKLEPGGVYYWRVFSETRTGTTRSDLYRFTLAP